MSSWLNTLLNMLALASVLGMLVALVLFLSGRRRLACTTNGLTLSTVAAGSLLAMLSNPDAGINLPGLLLWLGLVALAALSFYPSPAPGRETTLFWLGWLGSAGLAASLFYLLVGFKIF